MLIIPYLIKKKTQKKITKKPQKKEIHVRSLSWCKPFENKSVAVRYIDC